MFENVWVLLEFMQNLNGFEVLLYYFLVEFSVFAAIHNLCSLLENSRP